MVKVAANRLLCRVGELENIYVIGRIKLSAPKMSTFGKCDYVRLRDGGYGGYSSVDLWTADYPGLSRWTHGIMRVL